MKLYAWQPDTHGPLSFFVMANSEDEARAAVAEHIAQLGRDYAYEAKGWPHDQKLAVYEPGQVVTNYNE